MKKMLIGILLMTGIQSAFSLDCRTLNKKFSSKYMVSKCESSADNRTFTLNLYTYYQLPQMISKGSGCGKGPGVRCYVYSIFSGDEYMTFSDVTHWRRSLRAIKKAKRRCLKMEGYISNWRRGEFHCHISL